MNEKKLKEAEARFIQRYPNGFMHPELEAIGKKHKMEQMITLTQDCFTKSNFSDSKSITENMVKVISRSSMVSMFEKPKLRDAVSSMDSEQIDLLANGLKKQLYGDHQQGFEDLLKVLTPYKLGKWSLITLLPNYYRPNDEFFIKPTTAKGVIQYFELTELQYKPQPSWAFYTQYRTAFLQMKSLVSSVAAPSNAAFGGFLMMSIAA
jgi:hypothetical protein